MDHHKVRPPNADSFPSIHSAAPPPPCITHVDTPLRCTENWLYRLWSLHRAGSPRDVYSLRSHSVPFPRPPPAPELYPRAPGSGYPFIGRLPGSSLSALLPPARVLLIRVGETGSPWHIRRMAGHDDQRPSSQTICEARLAGVGHCKSNHTNGISFPSEFVRIGLLVPLCHRAGILASPVYPRARRQVS